MAAAKKRMKAMRDRWRARAVCANCASSCQMHDPRRFAAELQGGLQAWDPALEVAASLGWIEAVIGILTADEARRRGHDCGGRGLWQAAARRDRADGCLSGYSCIGGGFAR